MTQHLGSPARIALIGVSGYAEVYIDWLLEANKKGLIRLVAATILPHERNLPQALALQSIVSHVYDRYETMLVAESNKLDICFIPTGIQWHAPMAIAALKAGSNVLVEKPLAGSIADVESVQAAEKRYHKWVAVGFQDMYTSELLQLKQSILEGAIGKLKSVSTLGIWPRPKAYYQRNHWAGKLSVNEHAVLDSPMNNAFAHFVNLSLFLAGDTLEKSVNASVEQAELYHAHDIESFDTAVVQATAENGVSLWFGVTHASSDTVEPRIRIVGDKGHIVWEHEKDCTIYSTDKDPVSIQVPRYAQTRQKMFERVIARLTDPSVSICDTAIAKSHTSMIENLHQHTVIKSVPPGLIEDVELDSQSGVIPAIKDISARLTEAFETNGSLGDLNQQAIEA